MFHKFKVGQSVVPSRPVRSGSDTYRIVKQLPLTSYEPQYWVQGVKSGMDCVVCESQVKAAEEHQQSLSSAGLEALKIRPGAGKPA